MSSNNTKEKKLPIRILTLFIIILTLIILQSINNITSLNSVNRSIITVNQSNIELEKLSREMSTPISNIRILSMELVLAPNRLMIQEIKDNIENRIKYVDQNISTTELNLLDSSTEFQNIKTAWTNYINSQNKTMVYVNQSIRIAAFMSVTGQEKIAYDNLLAKLSSFSIKQLDSSEAVFNNAQKESSYTFWILLVSTIVVIVILIVILIIVLKMILGYIKSKQEYEVELSDAAVEVAVITPSATVTEAVLIVASTTGGIPGSPSEHNVKGAKGVIDCDAHKPTSFLSDCAIPSGSAKRAFFM